MPGGSGPPTSIEETDLLARWLEGPGARLHACEGSLAAGIDDGGRLAELLAALGAARRTTGAAASELAAKRRRRAG